MTTTNVGTKGKIVQVLGAVVDIEFPPDHLPEIYNELQTQVEGSDQVLSLLRTGAIASRPADD